MPAQPRRPRLSFDSWPAAVYAIGDVHGCLDQLLGLERQIMADGATIPGEKWIVTLGDYIDRGPASRAVVEHLLTPAPTGFRRFALAGNHEQLLLDFLADPGENLDWLRWGGLATAAAYGMPEGAGRGLLPAPAALAEQLRRLVPEAHLQFFRNLPGFLRLPGFLFVHAGIEPGRPLERQEDEALLWIRGPFLRDRAPRGFTVVHGHTPVDAIEFAPARINIDTGCFFSGRLTALRVKPDGAVGVLQEQGPQSNWEPADLW